MPWFSRFRPKPRAIPTYIEEGIAPEGKRKTIVSYMETFALNHLNFYRVHLLAFIFVPIISAAIFYASNGETHIQFIDALYSAFPPLQIHPLLCAPAASLIPPIWCGSVCIRDHGTSVWLS